MQSTLIINPPLAELELLLQNAEKLYALGIIPVPLCRPTSETTCSASWHTQPCKSVGKRPLLKGFRDFANVVPDWNWVRYELRRQWPCNLGIVVPQDAIVVEADSLEAEAEIAALAGEAIALAPVRERRLGRGRGWIFLVDRSWNLVQRTNAGSSKEIDILTPGAIFVVPPSIHRTGHRYEWVSGLTPWELKSSAPLPEALKQMASPITTAISVARMASDISPNISVRIQQLIQSRLQVRRLFNGEGKRSGDISASGLDFSLALELLRLRVPDDEIVAALAARAQSRRRDFDYCAQTVSSARRILEGK